MEDSLSHLEKYFKFVSDNWSDILNGTPSLSIPQVQTILLKRWQKLTNQMNTQEAKKNSKDKSVKSVPFFQQSIKNPYYAETNKETLDQEVTDTSNIDSKTFKGLDSDMKGQSKSEQKTSVEAENMSESESDETTITKEDIIRLTRPAKRKSKKSWRPPFIPVCRSFLCAGRLDADSVKQRSVKFV